MTISKARRASSCDGDDEGDDIFIGAEILTGEEAEVLMIGGLGGGAIDEGLMLLEAGVLEADLMRASCMVASIPKVESSISSIGDSIAEVAMDCCNS